jgi:hypothetical protein
MRERAHCLAVCCRSQVGAMGRGGLEEGHICVGDASDAVASLFKGQR